MPGILYLAVLFVYDTLYGHDFVVNEEMWKRCDACFALFALVTFYMLSYECLLAFMAMSKCMIVVKPIETSFKQQRFVVKCVAYLVVTIASISILLTVLVRQTVTKLPSVFCLPVLDGQNRTVSMEVVVWFICTHLLVGTVVIATVHCIMIHKLYSKTELSEEAKSLSDQGKYIPLVIQACSTTVSEAVFSLTKISILVAVSYLTTLSEKVTLPLATTVIPGNSVVNSLLFLVFGVRTFVKAKIGKQ